ncbi:hypothetical protein HCC70_04850 [Streptococcus suis]|uniref:Uncharacterized protein n=1 Tax=Streptococcus suivaginalis TaxID=3028082 RepID=A0AA96VS30_9STRE|nr:hypothetical protein [Streptococcus sp. 29896]MCK4027660.1 hypothetical protein [Streptococcus suis]WNY47190.1 hypothetical protein PXH68_00290 [Streptococcus sp. 29896]
MSEFYKKRIYYYNNWPIVDKFEAESEYFDLVQQIKKSQRIFIPFTLLDCDEKNFNIALSFIIDALEYIETKPNHSFEFMFKSFDNISKKLYSDNKSETNNITEVIRWLSSYLDNIFSTDHNLSKAFEKLISIIPLKSCQYLYLKISERDSRVRARLRTNTTFNNQVIENISMKYGSPDFSKYEASIRKPSLLYKRYLLNGKTFSIGSTSFNLNHEEVIFLLLSGYIYSLRNDSLHGSNMSITKSSKTSLATYANSFFAFMFLYYIVMIIFIERYYHGTTEQYSRLVENMEINCRSYTKMFGKILDN